MKLLVIAILAILVFDVSADANGVRTAEFEVVGIPGTNNHHADRPIKGEVFKKDELMHFTGYCTNDKGRGEIGDMICHLMVVSFKCSDVSFFRGVMNYSSYGDVKTLAEIKTSSDMKNIKFRIEDGQLGLKCEIQKKTSSEDAKFYCVGVDKLKEERVIVKGAKESINIKKWCDKPMMLRGLDYLN